MMDKKQIAKLSKKVHEAMEALEAVTATSCEFEADHMAAHAERLVRSLHQWTGNRVIDRQKAEQRDAVRYED